MSTQLVFHDVHVPFNSEFMVVRQSAGEDEVSLTEVFRVSPMAPLQEQSAANWSVTRGMRWNLASLHERRNLQGMTLRCVFIPEPPYIAVEKYDGGTPTILFGYTFELIKVLKQRLNFRTKYYIPDPAQYGTRLENGSWNGMVGEVLRQDADIGLNLFMVTNKRFSVIDYFPPIFNTRMIVHIKKPDVESSDYKHVVSEFTVDLWIASLVTFLIYMLLLSFTYYIERRISNEQKLTGYGLNDAWFCTMGIICQKRKENRL
ncbi:hypothetical protein ANN_21239 [Periplaneta americana]|uniref:Ionotropic glutamate receptor L-glutamate and glycine-binding domain-containing protein n=1 Tax=Periplaneta americana TaxID=6978 RepID=A0ABQ8SFP4_PERAM|nr:hypothetical protein ANN_21239 [Periplaneta americana]